MMSTKYKSKDNDKAYFVTITTVNWIDVFTRLNHKTTIINSLRYCQQQKRFRDLCLCFNAKSFTYDMQGKRRF